MIQTQIDQRGVFTITFDSPDSKVNTLSMPVMEELSGIFSQIEQDPVIECVVIQSAKPGVFIAGADIKDILAIELDEQAKVLVEKGQAIFNHCAALAVPTIAMIDGVCLGGGLELALACNYRFASIASATTLGLPEVNLGIIPGFGGTQRLSRLIGLPQALSMIVSGKPVSAQRAKKIGLVHDCFMPEFASESLDKWITQLLEKKGARSVFPRVSPVLKDRLIQWSFLGRVALAFATKKHILKKTKGHYPALIHAVNAVIRGYPKSLTKGLSLEAALFSKCFKTTVAKHLMGLFFNQERQKKWTVDAAKKEISQAAVVGAGLMGSGIAWCLAHRQVPVILKDIHKKELLKGMGAISGIFSYLAKTRRLSARKARLAMHRVTPSLSYHTFSSVSFAIEAVSENPDVKKMVYKELEKQLPADAILATNTSSLDVDALSADLAHPERFIGMHFFSPVNRMPLVEIIPTKYTSEPTLATVISLVKTLKKTPIVVKNCPGFLVNRIFLPYINEAIHCVIDGVKIKRLDTVLQSFGMPLGPLALADNVGLDVGVNVLNVLEKGFGSRMKCPDFVANMLYDKKWLGKKTGCGFYDYTRKKQTVNTKLQQQLSAFQMSFSGTIPTQHIQERCLFIMINEAVRCLDEGIVANATQLDLALILGTGFPPFRGGLCAYADELGLDYVAERLSYYARVYGPRFRPCKHLLNCIDSNESLIKGV